MVGRTVFREHQTYLQSLVAAVDVHVWVNLLGRFNGADMHHLVALEVCYEPTLADSASYHRSYPLTHGWREHTISTLPMPTQHMTTLPQPLRPSLRMLIPMQPIVRLKHRLLLRARKMVLEEIYTMQHPRHVNLQPIEPAKHRRLGVVGVDSLLRFLEAEGRERDWVEGETEVGEHDLDGLQERGVAHLLLRGAVDLLEEATHVGEEGLVAGEGGEDLVVKAG